MKTLDYGYGVKTTDTEWHLNSYFVFVDFGSPHYFGDWAQFKSEKKALSAAINLWPGNSAPAFIAVKLN